MDDVNGNGVSFHLGDSRMTLRDLNDIVAKHPELDENMLIGFTDGGGTNMVVTVELAPGEWYTDDEKFILLWS